MNDGNCACIQITDQLLRDSDTRLVRTFEVREEGMRMFPTLRTEKVGSGPGRPATVIPTFCPFCGIRYRPFQTGSDL